jgi:DNA (cytosine-5)-methyltransferase 1
MNELALFAGAGGGILGGHLMGWRTVCAVEWEPYPASVLVSRQNDCFLPPFPIWDDVQTFDGRPWRGIVDVVSGGFPCQDISAAGKGAGIDGERSGMWKHMARVVGEVRPRYVFVENSPMLVTRGLDRVLGDLTALGYHARWTVLGAADVGAPHQRDRLWLLAHSNHQHGRPQSQKQCHAQQGPRLESCGCGSSVAYARLQRLQERDRLHAWRQEADTSIASSQWWASEPDVGRVVDGMAARVDRLKAIGNGQVPQCAAAAWRMLGGPLT